MIDGMALLRASAALALASTATAWNDIAGALTYKGTSHVFQGCPGDCHGGCPPGQPGSSAHGWHHGEHFGVFHSHSHFN